MHDFISDFLEKIIDATKIVLLYVLVSICILSILVTLFGWITSFWISIVGFIASVFLTALTLLLADNMN